MLVDARERQTRQIESSSTLEHRFHQGVHLAAIETVEVDGHQQRRHLIVGHPTVGVGEDELMDLAWLQPLAIAFAFNQSRYDHLVSIGVSALSTLTS